MTRQRVLAIDCDSVLLDFNQAVYNLHKLLVGEPPKLLDFSAFKANKMYDLTTPEFTNVFTRYLREEPLFWASMPPMPNAKYYLDHMRYHFDKIVIVTAMHPKFIEARRHNLNSLGINVDDIISAGTPFCDFPTKKLALQKIGATVFIDDLASNFEGMEDLNCRLILLDHSYSDIRNYLPGVSYSRATSLAQVIKLIILDDAQFNELSVVQVERPQEEVQ